MSSGHKTVVAVDASQGALNALNWATTHACGAGDTLHLVHSYQPIHAIVGPQFEYTPTEAEQKRVRQQHESILTEFTLLAKGHLVAGDARDTLLSEAEKLHASGIVIGSRGLGQVKGAILGSVSHYVSQHSKLPVIVVPSANGPAKTQ